MSYKEQLKVMDPQQLIQEIQLLREWFALGSKATDLLDEVQARLTPGEPVPAVEPNGTQITLQFRLDKVNTWAGYRKELLTRLDLWYRDERWLAAMKRATIKPYFTHSPTETVNGLERHGLAEWINHDILRYCRKHLLSRLTVLLNPELGTETVRWAVQTPVLPINPEDYHAFRWNPETRTLSFHMWDFANKQDLVESVRYSISCWDPVDVEPTLRPFTIDQFVQLFDLLVSENHIEQLFGKKETLTVYYRGEEVLGCKALHLVLDVQGKQPITLEMKGLCSENF